MADSEGREIMKIGDTLAQDDWPRWIDLKSNNSGYVHIPAKDGARDTLLVYSRVDNSIWTLIEFTSWKQITASSLKLAEWIGLIGLGAVLMVVLLTHFLSRQFTKPIRRLVNAMRVYSVGGDNVELPRTMRMSSGIYSPATVSRMSGLKSCTCPWSAVMSSSAKLKLKRCRLILIRISCTICWTSLTGWRLRPARMS